MGLGVGVGGCSVGDPAAATAQHKGAKVPTLHFPYTFMGGFSPLDYGHHHHHHQRRSEINPIPPTTGTKTKQKQRKIVTTVLTCVLTTVLTKLN